MIQELNQLPQFRIIKFELEDSGRYTGVFDSVIELGEGWIGYLISQEEICISGRFFHFDVNSKTAIFKPEEPEHIKILEIGKVYAYVDGYWGERAALVLDRSSQWRKELFKSQDAIEFTLSDGSKMRGKIDQPPGFPVEREGKILQGAWDHEHCEICMEEISEYAQHHGYVDQSDVWVCENCYSKYIQPRRLGFIKQRNTGSERTEP